MNLNELVYCICYLDKGFDFHFSLSKLREEKAKLKTPEVEKPNKPKKKKLKPVLNKKLWSKIRSYMLNKHDHKCMKCGKTPKLKDLHVDHIKPKSKYPHLKYKIKNLQLLCKKCNFEKSNHNENDYRLCDE